MSQPFHKGKKYWRGKRRLIAVFVSLFHGLNILPELLSLSLLYGVLLRWFNCWDSVASGEMIQWICFANRKWKLLVPISKHCLNSPIRTEEDQVFQAQLKSVFLEHIQMHYLWSVTFPFHISEFIIYCHSQNWRYMTQTVEEPSLNKLELHGILTLYYLASFL